MVNYLLATNKHTDRHPTSFIQIQIENHSNKFKFENLRGIFLRVFCGKSLPSCPSVLSRKKTAKISVYNKFATYMHSTVVDRNLRLSDLP